MAAENFKVKKGLEVGTGATITSEGVNVTGIITATQFKGDGSGLTGVVGSGSGIVVKDEGSAVGTAGTVNFVGSGVAATLSAGTATVTINAGGLDNVVEDTTPQLGGNLDLNSKFITGTGNIDITGSLDVSGIATVGTLKGAIEATTASFSGAIDANGDLDVDGQTELDDLNVSGIATGTIFKVPDATNVSGATNHIAVGDNSDLKLYHDNNGDAQIFNSTGHLTIVNNTAGKIINLQPKSGANGVIARYEGAAELYHNGNLKLTTTINGIEVPDLNVTGVGTVGRLETNGVTLGTNNNTFAAKFIDDAVANFGTGNDLKIYHQNSDNNSYIKNTNGNLFFYATNTTVGLKLEPNAKVRIYHAGNAKLETDQAGVKITGVCTATSFSGSGAGLTSIPSAQLSGALPALDGSALTGITASGSGIIVKHDGSTVGTAGTINFSTNLDVSAISAGIVTVTASGSSGVSLSGSTNNTVATVTGANALIGEANLTFDGSTLGIAAGSDDMKVRLSGTSPYIQFREGTTNKAYIQWNPSGYIDLTNQESGEKLKLDDGESGLIWRVGSNDRTVWTSGNDGASSGLDADLLDGQEGSYYTNATNLGSGTIPNGRFPATLPATSGANLTSLNADNISSGTLASARIEDNAVTFDKLEDVANSRILGRVSSGAGNAEELTATQVRTLLNVADGATAGITTAPSNIVATWNVVNQGASAYRFTGPGQDPTANNPDIYLVRGNKYRFALSASGHPFQIRVSNGGSAYNDGVTNNGAQTGNVEFYVQNDAPASLVYQCTSHGGMVGNIYITGHQLTNGANNRIVTATSAYGMNGEANLTFDGNKLGVNRSGTLQYGISFAAAALDNNRIGWHDGSSSKKAAIGVDDSDDSLNFYTGASTTGRLRIDSDGAVNIGSNPAQATGTNTQNAILTVKGYPAGETSAAILALVRGNNTTSTAANHTMGRIVFSDKQAGEYAFIEGEAEANGAVGDTPGRLVFSTSSDNSSAPTERLRITSNGRVSINDGTRSADSATEGATLRVTGTPVTRNEYFSPHGHYFGAIGYTTDTHTKAWLAVDSHYAQSSAVSAGIFLSAFHQDAGGSDCGYTIKNLKTGNALVFSRVKTAASTGNPAVEEERVRITAAGNVGINDTDPSYALNVIGDNTASNGIGMLKGIIGVQNDTTAYGSYPTAGISFQTKYRTGPDVPLDVAAIYGGKENTTNGDKDGYMGFAVREEPGSGTQERMRISSGGNVGINTTIPGDKLHVAGGDIIISTASAPNLRLVKASGGTGGATLNAFFGIATANNNFFNGSVDNDLCIVAPTNGRFLFGYANSVKLRMDNDGTLFSAATYNNTTASGSRAVVMPNNTGEFFASTSSRRYKTNITTLTDALADKILECRPVSFNSTCDVDNKSKIFYGLIAEEVHEIDTSLVAYEDENAETPVPAGVQYDRFVPHLINLVKRQKAQIEALETRISALEGS